jgi:hypothetical protein
MIDDGPIKRDVKRSLNLRAKIASFSCRPGQIDSRQIAAAALYEITSEHHSSIALLLTFERFSTAQALIRPCVEASLRSLWLLHCLSQEEFEELQISQEWPGLDQVVGRVEAVHRQGGFIRKLLPPRKLLNDLTHGGFMQIADRLAPAMRRLVPEMPTHQELRERVAALCIRTSDRMLCLAAVAINLEIGDASGVERIQQAYEDTVKLYELGQASSSINQSEDD